ncbi:MAG TPA: hypothetical protein VFW19_06975 [Allosphingosinicella sp.]|nr:hypothetical protein [Allosphingosinicella sp.]
MRFQSFAAAALVVTGMAPARAITPTPPPSPCATPDHRAFDFWVGNWDVYRTGDTKLIAHSRIERLYAGCAIRENWMPLGGTGGGSLSAWVPEENAWRQTWVDSAGARVDFKGGIAGQAMVLTGFWKDVLGPGRSALVRMTYTREAAGAVRQKGDTSVDDGRSWQAAFDFLYRPAASQ